MLKSDAAAFLAGVTQVEGAAASAPTNLHVITGEVGTTSEEGKTTISIDGLVFSEEDSQEIEIDALGGLEEGDIATVILTGESGHGMTPLAIGAPGSVDRVRDAAAAAWDYADQANDAAVAAQGSADAAATAASNAQASASIASRYASTALGNLSTVQSVAETLEWVTEHGTMTLTADTAIDPSRVYFVTDTNGSYTVGGIKYSIVSEPDASDLSTYYELTIDESLNNYVATHLSLTNDGLWVIGDNSSYRLLAASDGIKVYDASGNLVSTFGESVTFSSDRPQYIGGEDAYIMYYDSDNDDVPDSIVISGDNVILGGDKSLSEMIAEVDATLIYDHTYEYNAAGTQATFTAHLFRGGEDIATTYDSSCFTWYYKTEAHSQHVYLGSGYTCTVTIADMGYGGHIVGKFTVPNEAALLTSNDDALTTSDDDELLARTASGDSVRVSDLSVATVLYPTDKVMVIGAEDEHLVTMATIQDYLESNFTKQVKFGTTAQWNAQTTLVSETGTLYVYTDHAVDSGGNAVAGIKVGDGNAYLLDLPFTDAVLMEHVADTTIHITSQERAFWNSKVRAYLTGNDQLVLTTS